MYGYLAQQLFTVQHPEAATVMGDVFALAKAKKLSPQSVYEETFAPVVKAKADLKQNREYDLQETPVDSINRSSDNVITPSQKNYTLADIDKMDLSTLKKLAPGMVQRATEAGNQ